ncbi:hypothetical protein AB0365_16965 [Brevibacterium casei]|uniref:hypothetical protein n=1 Tax=Brevibacterium casei TaxID=33889 RepID=UPI0034506EEC
MSIDRTAPFTGESHNPGHPDHEEYLLELGRATYAAAGLAGIAFDVLRIHGRFESAALYNDPLGTLENRLKGIRPPLDGIDEFLSLLAEARVVRNDLIHALPVKQGLHRRTSKWAAPVVRSGLCVSRRVPFRGCSGEHSRPG